MSKNLTKKKHQKIQETEPDEIQLKPVSRKNSFINFSYSYKSMTSFGGKTHIKSKEKRFADGKFESEEFEGTMDGSVYDTAVQEMQKKLFQQITSFFNPFSYFLPFGSKKEEEK